VFVDVVVAVDILFSGIFCVFVRSESVIASDARCFLPGVRVKNEEDDVFFAGESENAGARIGSMGVVANEAL
jgi:hypothetical protein